MSTSSSSDQSLTPVSHAAVTLTDTFWMPRARINREVTLPVEYEQCKSTGRIDAWKLDWKPGDPNPPHIFWDSDVAKWIEAAGLSLATHPDPKLMALVDGVIEMIAAAQQPDGYLNVHFTIVEPEKRWTNLRDWHELYCAGHLMEAAVAYRDGTGNDKLLKVMCRYADYIGSVFGREDGRKRGYPGHEEIELALVKLYRATGEERYLQLASYFVDERGRQPHYFDIEARERGQDPGKWQFGRYDYNQAHLPVRQQSTAEGHSVRACYLYAGMADVAAETGDGELLAACERIWNNIVSRRMYIHGGIGSSRFGERFTFDYDLPNEDAYAETCAAIALVFFAHRMLQARPDSRYADVMERALYNGTVSGVSLDGKHFFYDNLLAAHPQYHRFNQQKPPTRQEWFGCACCPPNIARLLASIGGYVYSQSADTIWTHLYVAGSMTADLAGNTVGLTQKTEYPWDGNVRITVSPASPAVFKLALRLPGWCRGVGIRVNGTPCNVAEITTAGYAIIEREWKTGDVVELTFPMPVERIEAHPSVRQDCGKIALQRGPIVYCLEEVDNGPDIADIALPMTSELVVTTDKTPFAGVPVIRGAAVRRDKSAWGDELYRPAGTPAIPVVLTAVPYCMWANRGPGEMTVWIGQCS